MKVEWTNKIFVYRLKTAYEILRSVLGSEMSMRDARARVTYPPAIITYAPAIVSYTQIQLLLIHLQ